MRVWPFGRRDRAFTTSYEEWAVSQVSSGIATHVRTAAIEACAGFLGRTLSDADVEGPEWVQRAVSPAWLTQVGRDLIRAGEHMSCITMGREAAVDLVTASSWNFEGGILDRDQTVRVSVHGPSHAETKLVSTDAVVFLKWGSLPGSTYRGSGPTSWASLTAKLQAELARSLGDEAGGPIAQLLAIPKMAKTDTVDPSATIRDRLGKARGRGLLLPTTAAAWGGGMSNAPRKDWVQNRLGPAPPESLAMLAKQAFMEMIAACGLSVALFDDSDGTSKREAFRQSHFNLVRPIARLLAHELSLKLGEPVKLRFDPYALDMISRAQVVDKLVAAGVPLAEARVVAMVGDA